MLESNSTSHVFRFVSMRPPNAVDETNVIRLSDNTGLVRSMADAGRNLRRELAQAYIRDHAPKIDAFVNGDIAVAFAKAIEKLQANGGKVGDLDAEIRGQKAA
jgi:hypothetical protein